MSISSDTSTCGHDDISVIIPVVSIYLSTTSAVFTPAGHVNILHWLRKQIQRGSHDHVAEDIHPAVCIECLCCHIYIQLNGFKYRK